MRPEPEDHPAHAVVFVRPEFPTEGAFRKLKELLAALIETPWPLPPSDAWVEEMRAALE